MRTTVLLAYLATFAVSIGSLIAFALLAVSDSFVSDSYRGGQFWLALALGLSIASFIGFRIQKWQWPHWTAIFIGPLIAVALFWFAEDFDAKARRSSEFFGSLGLTLDALLCRGLMLAAGLWFVSGNLGIALRTIATRSPSAGGMPNPPN